MRRVLLLLDNFCSRHYARRGNTLYDHCTPCEHLAVRVSDGWDKLPNLIPVAGPISRRFKKCSRALSRSIVSYKVTIYKTERTHKLKRRKRIVAGGHTAQTRYEIFALTGVCVCVCVFNNFILRI